MAEVERKQDRKAILVPVDFSPHSVAALLNASSSGVNYFYSEAEVVLTFNNAFASGEFEATKDAFTDANEAGCLLN